jgi:hypothetical protein
MDKLNKLEADFGAPEVSEKWSSDFPIPPRTTGTIDDDDDPAHEQSCENEACVLQLVKARPTRF